MVETIEVLRNGETKEVEKQRVAKLLDKVRNSQSDQTAKRLKEMLPYLCGISIQDKIYLEEDLPWITIYMGEDPKQERVFLDKKRNMILWALLLEMSSNN